MTARRLFHPPHGHRRSGASWISSRWASILAEPYSIDRDPLFLNVTHVAHPFKADVRLATGSVTDDFHARPERCRMVEDENRATEQDRPAEGHHDLVGQPHSDGPGPVAQAEMLAAQMTSEEQPLDHSVVDSTVGPRSTSG